MRLVVAGALAVGVAFAMGVGFAAPASATPAAAPTTTTTEAARSGTYTAALTLRVEGDDPSYRRIRSARLRVEHAGARVLDRELRLPSACRVGVCVALRGARTHELRRLDGPPPVAVLWWWTGGAHCCSIVEVVEIPTGRTATRDFGNGGATIRRLGGKLRFVGQDERFPYRYTSYAASGSPIAIFRHGRGRFVDVTGEHPSAVRADADRWWSAYAGVRKRRDEARGVFAAWAADTCRLGQRERVEAALAAGVAAGVFSPPRAEPDGPHGARYAAVLLRDLTRMGYCPAT